MTKLGIIDWGIGGLAVYRLLPKAKRKSVIYFSDSGYTPYGKVPADELVRRLKEVIAYLREQGAGDILVACNAASTVLPELRDAKVAGVIEPTIQYVATRREKSVGVMGGERTIASKIYSRGLSHTGKTVSEVVAQPLSALVERGELDTTLLHSEVERIVRPIAEVDLLVVACTHYTAIVPAIRRVAERSTIVDPANHCIENTAHLWRNGEEIPRDVFQTSGDPTASQKSAELAFDLSTPTWTKSFP